MDLVAKQTRIAEGVKRMTSMIGVHSLKHGSDYEEAAAAAELEAVRADMCDPETPEAEGYDDMRDLLVAGDVVLDESTRTNEPQKQAQPPAQPAPQPKQNKILSAGLAAFGLGAGLTLPILAWNMTRQPDDAAKDAYNMRAIDPYAIDPRTER